VIEIGGQLVELDLHLDVVALCLGLLVGYAELIRRYGPLFHPRPDERAVSRRQVASFVSGVAVLWLVSGSPLHDIAERYLFSAHMVQHLLQAFVMAPLLYLGIPTWMGELLARPRWVRAPLQVIGTPLVAALVFNGVLLFIHWPAVVELMVTSEAFHGVAHLALVLSALAMWLPLLSPAPSVVPRLKPTSQMLYLLAMTILPTVPASYLVFGEEPLYRIYETFPRLWGLTVVEDMTIAGLIMKVGGGFFLWTIIAVMFFRWAADEERASGQPSSLTGRRPDPSDAPSPSDVTSS
jgi:putative membrane protein